MSGEMFAQTLSEIVSLISLFAFTALVAAVSMVVGDRRAKVRAARARRELHR
jgi:hypothetical protein